MLGPNGTARAGNAWAGIDDDLGVEDERGRGQDRQREASRERDREVARSAPRQQLPTRPTSAPAPPPQMLAPTAPPATAIAAPAIAVSPAGRQIIVRFFFFYILPVV